MVEQAPAKINLTLRVLRGRADGYHDLESLVVFADLTDTLTLQPGGAAALEVAGPFAAATGPDAGNLVLKAHAALRERLPGLKAGRFQLTKNIVVAAGLGGGSSDAAAALATGADVPVCLSGKARVMRGVGEELSAPLDLPVLPALLVNPGVSLGTREVFAKFAGSQDGKAHADVPRDRDALIAWLAERNNDLTKSAIACEPAIGDVLAALRALPGARLVRMSGSGPTCFAVFGSTAEAAASSNTLAAAHAGWWIRPVTLGAPRP